MEVGARHLAADSWSRVSAGLPSLLRRRRDLPAGRGEDSASRVVPSRTRVLQIARPSDAVPECGCVLSTRDSFADGSRFTLMACGVDFLTAPRLLGVNRTVFPGFEESAMGWSMSGGRALDDSRGWHRALPPGSVS